MAGMPWEASEEETPWADREAWRGEAHPELADAWQPADEAGQAWAPEDEEVVIEIIDLTEEGWPEDLAGPEYWLFKRDGD